MAYIQDDPNKKPQDAQQSQGMTGDAGVSAFAGMTGGASSNPIQGGNSTPSSNPGYTPIQRYLEANQGNTSSGNLLNQQSNKTIDDNQKGLQDSSSQAKSDAQSQVDKVNIGQDKASQLIQQATQAGKGSDPYNQITSQLRSATSDAYSAPTSYAYGDTADYQNLGSGLQGQNFNNYMQGLYQKASGGQMSQGAMNLQTALDLDPTAAGAIQDARTAALNRMAGFDATKAQTLADTNSALQGAAQDYGAKQAGLNQFLKTQEGGDQSSLQGLVDAWNRAQATNSATNPYSGTAPWVQGVSATDPNYITKTLGIDPGKFASYAPGETATMENVSGGDPYRNEWNTINDVLGGGKAYGAANAPAAGKWNFDRSAYEQAVRAADAARLKALGDNTGFTITRPNVQLGTISSGGMV